MSSELHRRATELFLAAQELAADEREAFLDRECAGRPELREEVRSLLAAADESESFLASPALGEDFQISDATRPGAPALPGPIGPYVPIERLGSGGFGIVYLAEQREPVRRRVALKLIKPGMDTEEVVARFALEREALARMDHPNVATVLDAGVTPQGRPYFVMELVPGVPITRYCDDARLPVRERLELFVTVCEAVQHAHQKGIVHRDLKPSNVLVRHVAGGATPKVIDFGVAKALHEPLSGDARHTLRGDVVGTPEYMSPEQAESSRLDVDTRTDIYSLGVLLYELLSGTLPIDPQSSGTGSQAELARAVREEVAPPPSRRVRTASEAEAAARRGTTRERLARDLSGDLDWITLKAIEKDRLRRYDSASALADDVRRHLSNEPVSAGPPSASYRLRKFVARNRVAVGAGLVVVVALLASVVGVTLAMVRAKHERDRALGAERLAAERLEEVAQQRNRAVEAEALAALRLEDVEAARLEAIAAREEAEAEAAEASAVTAFLKETWALASPEVADGRELSAVDLLGRASQRLDTGIAGQPTLEVSLRTTLGLIYMDLAQYREGEREFRAALLVGRQTRSGNDAQLATLMHNLSRALTAQGRWSEAEPLIEEALAMRKRLFGEDHVEVSTSYDSKGRLLQELGRIREAEPWLRRAYTIARDTWGPGHDQTLVSANNLAMLLKDLGQFDEAAELFEAVYELRRVHQGEHHPNTITVISNLANLWDELGRHDEAAEAFELVLAARRAAYGDKHLLTAHSLNNLATQYVRQDRHDEAVSMVREALRIIELELGESHAVAITATNNLASTLLGAGRPEEALELAERAVWLTQESMPPQHMLQGFTRSILGAVLVELERYEDGEVVLLEAYELLAETRGSGKRETINAARRLALIYDGLGDEEEALRWQAIADEAELPKR